MYKYIMIGFLNLLICMYIPTISWGKIINKNSVVSAKIIHNRNLYFRERSYILAIELSILPNYYINSNRGNNCSLILTNFILKKNKDFIFSKVFFPLGKQCSYKGIDNLFYVLNGKIILLLNIFVTKNAINGEHFLFARLQYQACNNNSCLIPEDLDISIPILVGSYNYDSIILS